MMAYKVDMQFNPTVYEFSYEKKTQYMFTGCKLTREIVGRCYYLAGRIEKHGCYATADEALAVARESLSKQLNLIKSELGQVDKAISECA